MKTLIAIIALLALTSCGLKETYPEAFGLYLTDDQKSGIEKYRLLRDNDAVQTIDIDIDGKWSILVFDKSIANNPNSIKIRSGAFVRNFRKNDPWKGNLPVQKLRSWGLYKQRSVEVPGQVFPVKGHPDLLVWKPNADVKPGLYFLEIEGGPMERPRSLEPFFIKRAAVLANLESSDLCFDYYQYFMDPTHRFFPCSQNFSESGTPAPPVAQAPAATATPAQIPDPRSAVQSAHSLNPAWYGRWESLDSKRIYTISPNKLVVTQRQNSKDGYGNFSLNWVGKFDSQENTFGYAGKSISGVELSKDFEDAVKESTRPGSDIKIEGVAVARNALSGFLRGNYKVVTGYLGGDCATWDWAIEGDMMLEIQRCKYHYGVSLLTRMK